MAANAMNHQNYALCGGTFPPTTPTQSYHNYVPPTPNQSYHNSIGSVSIRAARPFRFKNVTATASSNQLFFCYYYRTLTNYLSNYSRIISCQQRLLNLR
jgi:hypothetical protein